MDVVEGLSGGNSYLGGIDSAFLDRYDSFIREEEASAVLDSIILESHREEEVDDRAALTSLVNKIEITVPVALPAHRESA